jgi:CheY-like chemotaxis protein
VTRVPHSHRLKVLCAEDFPTNQIIIRTMLEDLGHYADVVANGQLAVAACAHADYDLILMDGRMPEMDGASATRLIRAGGPPQAPVRDPGLMIVALTANASEEDRARYLASGMDDFLTKPIDEWALYAQLGRAVLRQLERGVALAPMPPRGPSTSELDAMFGVVTAPDGDAGAGQDGSLLRRIRAAFAADLPARRKELEEAVAARDHDTAALLLHGMKGSAGHLRQTALQALCGELESAADARDWAALEAGLARLYALLDGFGTEPASTGLGENG